MTKAELISDIAIRTGYDKRTINVVVESVMMSIKEEMGNGQNVYLRGFGTFSVKHRKEKMARNIKERTSVYVPAHNVPDFKPAAEFRAAVNAKKPNNKKK